MFIQINSNCNNYFSYDSDTSSYSEYSNYSSESNSSNTSNFTITSDPINYYMKDNLKQNYQQFLKQRQKQQQHNQLYSLRTKQSQNYLEMRRLMLRYKYEKNNNVDNDNQYVCQTIGYNTGFDKNTPFINYLIDKRINFCELGASSHIAAFVPVTNNFRYCFIQEWKGKDHYG